jgi:hypothetical protein
MCSRKYLHHDLTVFKCLHAEGLNIHQTEKWLKSVCPWNIECSYKKSGVKNSPYARSCFRYGYRCTVWSPKYKQNARKVPLLVCVFFVTLVNDTVSTAEESVLSPVLSESHYDCLLPYFITISSCNWTGHVGVTQHCHTNCLLDCYILVFCYSFHEHRGSITAQTDSEYWVKYVQM